MKKGNGSIQVRLLYGYDTAPSTDVADRVVLPHRIIFDQNFPNPFNPTTTIGYTIHAMQHVTLEVFDILGHRVATLVDEQQAASYYDVTYDATGLPSGIYVYRLNVERQSLSKTLMLLK